VDDWALCKSKTYGTILVDLKRHRVVDLLPDRSAATLAAWLRHHHGVRTVEGLTATGSRRDGARRAEGCMTAATSITVWVPLTIRRRPGQKTIVTPVTDGVSPAITRADPALVRALVSA